MLSNSPDASAPVESTDYVTAHRSAVTRQPPDAPATRWRPWITYGLIVANLLMFSFEYAASATFDVDTMVALGANYGPLTATGQSWRLLSAMFMHAGFLHIGMNMLCLYQIRIVEHLFGRAEFLALYLASGLIGGFASVVIHPQVLSVGASGAIFGLFGAFTAATMVSRREMGSGAWHRTMRSLGTFFALNLMFGLAQPGIDLSAHVGGLVAGFAGGFALARTRRPSSNHLVRALLVGLLGAGLSVGGLSFVAHG